MKWLNLNDDLLKNTEIQLPLDVYTEENQYPMISSSRKKKDKKRISHDINDYQAVLIDNTEISKEDHDISLESLVREDNNKSIQSNLVDFGLKTIKKVKSDNMVKSYDKKDLMKKELKTIYGIDVVEKKSKKNCLLILLV
jgi:hypothetical protein